MFFYTMNRSSTPQGRRKREKFPKDGRHGTIVFGRVCTIIGALFVVWVGAGLAQIFLFVTFQPCVNTNNNHNSELTAVSSSPRFSLNDGGTLLKNNPSISVDGRGNRSTKNDKNTVVVGSISTGTSKVKVSPFPATAKFPPQCTADQYDILKEQLPADGCVNGKYSPWDIQGCSFASSTVCGNSSPKWFYDYIQEEENDDDNTDNDNDATFRAIIVGCNKGYRAIDLLRITSPPSQDTSKYDWKEWESKFLHIDGSDNIDERVSFQQFFMVVLSLISILAIILRRRRSLHNIIFLCLFVCRILKVHCPIDDTVPSNSKGMFKKSQIFCIEGYHKTHDQLVKVKDALEYGDELDFTNMVASSVMERKGNTTKVYPKDRIGAIGVGVAWWEKYCISNPEICVDIETDSIDNWMKTKPSLMTNKPPIHFMSITAEGSDYAILQGTVQNLERIQYLDFRYHWTYRWKNKDLKDLIFRLKKRGFVCYWTGSNGDNLWRITDCWQKHYGIKFASSIGCVNSNIPAAEPLLNRMEKMFLQTLQKSGLDGL